MAIVYDTGQGKQKNWLVRQTEFSPLFLGKTESIFSQGNGYLGLRSAEPEEYPGQTRGMFITASFDEIAGEVEELPNAADMLATSVMIDGQPFSLMAGEIINYEKELCLRDGELHRRITWKSPGEQIFHIVFRHFVSLSQNHLICTSLCIRPLDTDHTISLISGINGRVTNSGAQHFLEGDKRIYDETIVSYDQTTQQSGIVFVHAKQNKISVDRQAYESRVHYVTGRRKIALRYEIPLKSGQELRLQSFCLVATSRDKEYDNHQTSDIRESLFAILKESHSRGYEELLLDSQIAWNNYWDDCHIKIEGDNFSQLATRFAQYHLRIMTPYHDDRASTAAKGLSGEGYKGHVFWDNEIYVLPYFIYTDPPIAHSLLRYRFHSLEGARKKAQDNNYAGAMYAWESAWTGEETTPLWGDPDLVTGEQTKIWCGIIEHHITADVAFSVWHYYRASEDNQFMDDYGYEIIYESANFWASRAEKEEGDPLYHIRDVMGPNEYKEHVDDNAYTNYMAQWNLCCAMKVYDAHRYNTQHREKFISCSSDTHYNKWKDVAEHLYTPSANEVGIIPENADFLAKKIIDLHAYRNQKKVGSIMKDYSLHELNDIQVCKQADVLALFYLLGHLFDPVIRQKNWNYYEPKTLHDSSLSLGFHALLASDMGQQDKAYELFHKASCIDLGSSMTSSDAGIHAASFGGLWQAVVMGFAGFRLEEDRAFLNPRLPHQWKSLCFTLWLKGSQLRIDIGHESLKIQRTVKGAQQPVIIIYAKEYTIDHSLSIRI